MFPVEAIPAGKRETVRLAYGNVRDLIRDAQALESLNPRENVVKILVRLRFSKNLTGLDRAHADIRFSEIAESGKRRYMVCWCSLHGACEL